MAKQLHLPEQGTMATHLDVGFKTIEVAPFKECIRITPQTVTARAVGHLVIPNDRTAVLELAEAMLAATGGSLSDLVHHVLDYGMDATSLRLEQVQEAIQAYGEGKWYIRDIRTNRYFHHALFHPSHSQNIPAVFGEKVGAMQLAGIKRTQEMMELIKEFYPEYEGRLDVERISTKQADPTTNASS